MKLLSYTVYNSIIDTKWTVAYLGGWPAKIMTAHELKSEMMFMLKEQLTSWETKWSLRCSQAGSILKQCHLVSICNEWIYTERLRNSAGPSSTPTRLLFSTMQRQSISWKILNSMSSVRVRPHHDSKEQQLQGKSTVCQWQQVTHQN